MAAIASAGTDILDEINAVSSSDEETVLEEGGGDAGAGSEENEGDGAPQEDIDGDGVMGDGEVDVTNLVDADGEIKDTNKRKLYRVIQTVYKMLSNRGYVISEERKQRRRKPEGLWK